MRRRALSRRLLAATAGGQGSAAQRLGGAMGVVGGWLHLRSQACRWIGRAVELLGLLGLCSVVGVGGTGGWRGMVAEDF